MQSLAVVMPTIAQDVTIVVPSSPQLLTTFVLHEQHDWFEDEIRFIRRFIRSGMLVVDIGANYGVYALTMATLVGDTGHVWAFEPTTQTAEHLRESITQNQFGNVTLVQAGLSDKIGEAKLFTSPNSELNSLSPTAGGGHESIQLLTLDHCCNQFGWEQLDFIKLDAEGEETRILQAAHETLSKLSPLIMFELKHGAAVNLPLIDRFAQLGYDCYRLIPGINALMRFDVHAPFDGYLLNLFCCKPNTATQLERDGLLVGNSPSVTTTAASAGTYFARLPCGAIQLQCFDAATMGDYRGILDDYVTSLSGALRAATRLAHLQRALAGLRRLLAEGEQCPARLATFSRIAFDAGERSLGVQLLAKLMEMDAAGSGFQLREPFLPASPRYDELVPGANIDEWLLASVLEQYIEKHAFSTYFTGATCLPMFEQLERIGLLSEPMRRRYYLTKARATPS